jgi:hypothetical protein
MYSGLERSKGDYLNGGLLLKRHCFILKGKIEGNGIKRRIFEWGYYWEILMVWSIESNNEQQKFQF